MYSGQIVDIHQVLESRTLRSHKQKEWVNSHSLPVVCFTINMVGNIKRNLIAKLAFDAGYQAIINACIEGGYSIAKFEKLELSTGYELMLSVDTLDVFALKHAMVKIEETHRCGRLFDIDVISLDGRAISREELCLPRRKCLVCHLEAKGCARSRRHTLPELIQKMSEIVNDYQ